MESHARGIVHVHAHHVRESRVSLGNISKRRGKMPSGHYQGEQLYAEDAMGNGYGTFGNLTFGG